MEPVQQLLNAGVAFDVDRRVRMTVPRQKLSEAKRSRRMTRSHEHDVSKTLRDYFDPPQDEGSHEDFAQLAVGLHKRDQMLAIQLDHVAGLARADSHQSTPTREHVDLARKLAGA